MLRLCFFLVCCLFFPPLYGDAAEDIETGSTLAELTALRRTPAGADRYAEEARLLFKLGQEASGDGKRAYHEEGQRLADQARAESPERPAALLWWSLHASAIAGLDKNLAALRRIKEIESTLLRLRELAPGFDHAAADRTLGLLYKNAPSIISVGSTARASKHLRAAYGRDPDYPGNCVFLADFLLGEGEKLEARRLVKRCAGSEALAAYPREAVEWGRIATRVLERTRL